ncbi:hypothetical protein ACFYU8_18945 [Brevibacillus sp. NPDC003359]|uniref:hypothetical protein n=1 Tax=unclassified Brevibacillus TaxID=2684853 RepID=UPI0036B3F586
MMVEVLQPLLSFLEREVYQLEDIHEDSRAFQDPSIKAMFQHAVSNAESINEILGQLAAFLDSEADTYKKGLSCIMSGTLVEYGGDPSLIVDSVVRQLERHLLLIETYLANEELSVEEHFLSRPDTVKARVTSDFVILATMTMICRYKQARNQMRQKEELVRLIESLYEHIDNLEYVHDVLNSVDDLEVVVLHPETFTGVRVRLETVQNNFHLFTLLQDVMLRSFQEKEPFASMQRNEVAIKAASGIEYPETSGASDEALFGFFNAYGLDENSSQMKQNQLEGWVFGEMMPTHIPRIDGKALILLGENIFASRSWDLSFCVPVHSALSPRTELLEVLSPEQTKTWLDKIVAMRGRDD